MILDALVHQLAQRFQHEKRARVCLWFDEHREFFWLPPAFRGHFATMTGSPFRLLEYGHEGSRGQICQIRARAEMQDLPSASRVADRAHADYANALNTRFFQVLLAAGSVAVPGLPDVTEHLEQRVWHAPGRRAVSKAHLNKLGIDHDLRAYDFTVEAINLNQAKEGSETAVAFFIALVSCLLSKPLQDQTVVLGEMSVQGMLLKVSALPERMQLAVESGAKRILIPSENKHDVAEVPDAILTAIQWQFYDSAIKAAILATGMG